MILPSFSGRRGCPSLAPTFFRPLPTVWADPRSSIRAFGWASSTRIRRPLSRRLSENGLTPAQARIAERLLGRARAERGPVRGFRHALRIGGIIAAVKRGLVGNSAWG